METDRAWHLGVRSTVALLLIALWATVAFWSFSERERVIAARENELAKHTIAIEEQTLRLFKLAEVSLLAAANWVKEHPQAFPAQEPSFIRLVAQLQRVCDGALEIRLVDSAGALYVVPSNLPQPMGNVSDHADIRLQLSRLNHGLYISDPVISPVNKKWVVAVTYPVPKPDGDLTILAAILDLDRIAPMFDSQRDKPNGSITILKTNGVTLLRSPATEGAIGKSIVKSRDFIEHLSAVERGQFRLKGAFDGVDRLISHARLTSYPLIIAVTASLDDALIPWRREVVTILAIVFSVTVAILLVTHRFLRVGDESRARLQKSEQRFRSLRERAPDPTWIIEGNRYVECNEAAMRVLGYTNREQLLNVHPSTLSPPKQADGEDSFSKAECMIAIAKEKGLHRFEWIHTKADGSNFMAEVTLSVIELADRQVIYCGWRDVSERKLAEEQIRNLAYFDALTKLPNRRLLLDRLAQALISSTRTQEFGALMILDLDNFKALNDTQGHDAGDRLLIDVAERIVASVRQEDTVSRLGGDEYVLMVEGLGLDETAAATKAEMIADKTRLALNQPYILAPSGQTHYSTPSIGVTLFRSQNLSVDDLLKQADVALYQAKGAGRNTVRFFNSQMQATIESRSAMEAALRNGLQQGEFQVFYQPQFDQDGRRFGAEALLRWLPAHQSAVSPAQFIPLAEDTGLIIPIGLWVMQTACAQLKTWEQSFHTRDLKIAINVSARQFRQADFVEQVRDSLQHSGAKPALLKLELTESVVLENVEEVIERMHQIKAMGVTFSLDDFGTGFSSLSYLKRLPLDQVKIDQSFVRDISTDPNDAAIVRAITAMSSSLGLQVIAEGVETQEQIEFLKECGCKNYQGYLLGKPLPISEWGPIAESDIDQINREIPRLSGRADAFGAA